VGVDEGETSTRRRVWINGAAASRRIILAARILSLTLAAAQFVTRLREGSGEITTAQLTGHEPEPCRTPFRTQTALPNRAASQTVLPL
jgi:hypothetical protein